MNKQIISLEEEVGTPLFDRWRGRWILNEDGRLLAAKAFQAILEICTGVDLVQSHVRLRTDHLAVGYSTILSPANTIETASQRNHSI